LLDKSTNGNQTNLSMTYGKKFGNCKIALANDVLLFDNKSIDMLVSKVITTYSKGIFSMEGFVSYCPIFKGGSMGILRLSSAIMVDGYSFRLFIWEKYANGKFLTPMSFQVGKKIFEFSNGNSLSIDAAYHVKDVTSKKLEPFGWCSIQVNF